MQCSVDKECGLKSQGGDDDEAETKTKEPSPKGVRFVADATVEPSAEEVAEPTEAPEPAEASGSGGEGADGAGDEAAAILAAAQDATAAVANAEGAEAGEEEEEEDVPVTGFGKARNSMWTGKKCRKGGGDKLDLVTGQGRDGKGSGECGRTKSGWSSWLVVCMAAPTARGRAGGLCESVRGLSSPRRPTQLESIQLCCQTGHNA